MYECVQCFAFIYIQKEIHVFFKWLRNWNKSELCMIKLLPNHIFSGEKKKFNTNNNFKQSSNIYNIVF